MVGRRWDELATELALMLVRGSVGLAREPADAVRANHFVGLAKKLESPEGDVERLKEGKEGEGLMAVWLGGLSCGCGCMRG